MFYYLASLMHLNPPRLYIFSLMVLSKLALHFISGCWPQAILSAQKNCSKWFRYEEIFPVSKNPNVDIFLWRKKNLFLLPQCHNLVRGSVIMTAQFSLITSLLAEVIVLLFIHITIWSTWYFCVWTMAEMVLLFP